MWAMRWRTSSREVVTAWPMMLEWNCSRLVMMVPSVAVPTAPPRLRSMLNRPDALAASLGAMPSIAIAVSGVMTMACPTARTMFGRKNWSPE